VQLFLCDHTFSVIFQLTVFIFHRHSFSVTVTITVTY